MDIQRHHAKVRGLAELPLAQNNQKKTITTRLGKADKLIGKLLI